MVCCAQAMGEGAIEGGPEAYEIDAKEPFSILFKYARFHATHASPRDVAALTGVHRGIKVGLEAAFSRGDDVMADLAAAVE